MVHTLLSCGHKSWNKTSRALETLTQPNTLFRQGLAGPLRREAGETKKESPRGMMGRRTIAFLTDVCLIISRAVAFSFLCLVNIMSMDFVLV